MAVFAGGCTFADVEAVCADAGEAILDELESLVDKALVQVDGQGDRLRMLQTIGEYARERLEAAGESSRDRAQARAPVCGARPRDPRRHRGHGSDRRPSSAASPRRAISKPRSTRSSTAAQGGDAAACEAGLQLCGDLFFYWHIRGKNLTAREYAAAFLEADAARADAAGGRAR